MITVPYEVKKALRDGMLRKNYRFVVLNDDGTEDFTIDNDTLVSESVNIDERMCSGDTLKFGLCEGSSLEFQYFFVNRGSYNSATSYAHNELVAYNSKTWRSKTDDNIGHTPSEGTYWTEFPTANIYGRRVQVFVDVQYEKVVTEYVWETQASFNNYYTITNMSGECRLYSQLSNAWQFVYVRENGTDTQVYPTTSSSGTVVTLGDVTGRTLMVTLDVMPAPLAALQLLVAHTGPVIRTYSIPLGFFDVAKCSRQASTGIIKVTAYNKLQSDYLDAKANDLLIEAFKSGDVYLKDIVDILLSDYKIKSEDKTRISFGLDSGYIDEQTAFRFTDLYGDQGVFSASRYKNSGVTTSTNCYFRAFYRSLTWQYGSEFTPSDYMRIESGVYNLNEIDQTMNALIESQAQKMITNKTSEALLQLIQNAFAYTFCIVVRVNTPYTHNLYFSNTGYKIGNQDFDGDFSDVLNRLNNHVLSIEFRYPHQINLKTDNMLLMDATLNFETTENTYQYYETASSTELTTKVFEIPHFPYIQQTNFIGVYKITNLCDADLLKVDVSELPDVTLRELQSAIYETVCQYGQLDRTTDLFSGVELNYGGLYPADTLYPANDLYPGGAALSGAKSMYSKLWADEGNVHKWRYLIITYKGLDEELNEVDYTLQRTVNADGTDDYNMSDNWLFRNLVWTAADVGDYADAMVAKMQDVTWFPFEMWCAGLPYLETGDEIEIPLNGESYTSYILQRQLKGIQNLQDTYINGTLDIF